MQVPNCTSDFCSIESSPGLTETPLPLQVEEELQQDHKVDHFFSKKLKDNKNKPTQVKTNLQQVTQEQHQISWS